MKHIVKTTWAVSDALWMIDRELYDRKLLVYGGTAQQCLAVAIGSAVGLLIGIAAVMSFVA